MRSAGLVFLLTTQMIPAGMLLIPIYLLLAHLQLTNTYRGLVLAYIVSSIPFSIWILKGYYDTIPIDLEEAAMIDGASRLGTFTRMVLPLSTPALAIVFLFNFMQAWQEFPVAYRVVTKETMWTWTLGINAMQGQFQTEWGMYAAGLGLDHAAGRPLVPVLGQVAGQRPDAGQRQGLMNSDSDRRVAQADCIPMRSLSMKRHAGCRCLRKMNQ